MKADVLLICSIVPRSWEVYLNGQRFWFSETKTCTGFVMDVDAARPMTIAEAKAVTKAISEWMGENDDDCL